MILHNISNRDQNLCFIFYIFLFCLLQNLKHNVDNADMQSSHRLDFKDASFNVVKAIMHFLYTGKVEAQFLESRGLDLLLAAHKVSISSSRPCFKA